MADENGSGPSPDQNAAANPPATASTPAASSLPAPDFDTRVRGAKNLAEFKALKEEALKPQAAKPPGTPPAGTTPAGGTPPDLAKPQGEGDPAAAGEGDATPAPEGEANTPEVPDPDADGDDDDVADGPPTIPTSKRIRIAPKQTDQVGRLAATLLQRNKDWDMEDAMAAARKQLGVKPKAEPAADTPADAPQSNLPQTVADVDQTVDRLEAEMEAAQVGLRFEDAAKLSRQIRQLDRHRLKLERDGERAETQRVDAFSAAFNTSAEKALTLYPFANDPASAGAKRMLEIDAALKANGDPLYDSPDRPLKVAQMAAAELNIAPLRKGASPAPKPPAGAAPAVTTPKKQVLPGGGSQTTPAPVNQIPADVARVSKIKTMADLRAEKRALGIPD